MNATTAAQEALPAHEPPVLTRAAIEGKLLPMRDFIMRLAKKPRPTPSPRPKAANSTGGNATNATDADGNATSPDVNATAEEDDEAAPEPAADGADAGADAPANGEAFDEL